jgi:hypothetical protein
MAKKEFPKKELGYLQTNRSNVVGTLWSTFGMDFQSNVGVARVAPRLRVNTASVTNQGTAVAFRYFDQRWFAICGTRVFKNASESLLSPFVEDTSTGAATDYSAGYSDLEFFNETLCATTTDALLSKAVNGSGTGDWTSRATITASTMHKLCYFKKFNRLYYLNAFKTIRSIDTAWVEATSGDYFLDTSDYTYGFLNTMVADDSSIWIGTKQIVPSGILNPAVGAVVLQWDGISSQPTASYGINASGVMAMAFDNKKQLHILDSNGALLAFTGSGFEEVGRLPLNRQLLTNSTSDSYNSFIHPNGLWFTRNNTFIALINNLVGDNGGTIVENLPSGIWEYSADTGFVHRQTATYNAIGSSTVTDYGQNRVARVGALVEPNFYSTNSSGKPTLLAGIDYYTNASDSTSGIFTDDPLNTIQKKGYMVNTWFSSDEIEDTWDKFWGVYRRLLQSTDTIDLKYRLSEEDPIEASITWVNTTSFTTTTDVTTYAPTATGFNGTVGGEVEITQGTGGASIAHITNVVNNAGTYTVTLDTAITGVTTGTAKARFQKWIKMYPAQPLTQVKSYSQWGIGGTDTRVQLKVCFTFTGNGEFYKSIIVSNEDIKALG